MQSSSDNQKGEEGVTATATATPTPTTAANADADADADAVLGVMDVAAAAAAAAANALPPQPQQPQPAAHSSPRVLPPRPAPLVNNVNASSSRRKISWGSAVSSVVQQVNPLEQEAETFILSSIEDLDNKSRNNNNYSNSNNNSNNNNSKPDIFEFVPHGSEGVFFLDSTVANANNNNNNNNNNTATAASNSNNSNKLRERSASHDVSLAPSDLRSANTNNSTSTNLVAAATAAANARTRAAAAHHHHHHHRRTETKTVEQDLFSITNALQALHNVDQSIILSPASSAYSMDHRVEQTHTANGSADLLAANAALLFRRKRSNKNIIMHTVNADGQISQISHPDAMAAAGMPRAIFHTTTTTTTTSSPSPTKPPPPTTTTAKSRWAKLGTSVAVTQGLKRNIQQNTKKTDGDGEEPSPQFAPTTAALEHISLDIVMDTSANDDDGGGGAGGGVPVNGDVGHYTDDDDDKSHDDTNHHNHNRQDHHPNPSNNNVHPNTTNDSNHNNGKKKSPMLAFLQEQRTIQAAVTVVKEQQAPYFVTLCIIVVLLAIAFILFYLLGNPPSKCCSCSLPVSYCSFVVVLFNTYYDCLLHCRRRHYELINLISFLLLFFLFKTAGIIDWDKSTNTTLIGTKGQVISDTSIAHSYWFLFAIRQLLTYALARGSEVLVIDLMCLKLRWINVFHSPLLTLLFVQSRGWPFRATTWAVYDFALLHGESKFVRHWIFYQDFLKIFNTANPSGNITTNQIYTNVLFLFMIIGLVTSCKRVFVGYMQGKRVFATYGE
jgi:hypothetical protein